MDSNNLSLGTRLTIALDPFVSSGEVPREAVSSFAAHYDQQKKIKLAKRLATPITEGATGEGEAAEGLTGLLLSFATENKDRAVSLKELIALAQSKDYKSTKSITATIYRLRNEKRLRKVGRALYQAPTAK